MGDDAVPDDATTIDSLDRWPRDLRDDLDRGRENGCVGTALMSETDRVRVWRLHVPPGVRFPFHTHVLDYFWTALASGRARYFSEDGHVTEAKVHEGQTEHFRYGAGEHRLHSIENIGDVELSYVTVEFLDSANAPLPVLEEVRAPHRVR